MKYVDFKNAKVAPGYLENNRSPKVFVPINFNVKDIDKIILGSNLPEKLQFAQFLYKSGVEKVVISKTEISL